MTAASIQFYSRFVETFRNGDRDRFLRSKATAATVPPPAPLLAAQVRPLEKTGTGLVSATRCYT